MVPPKFDPLAVLGLADNPELFENYLDTTILDLAKARVRELHRLYHPDRNPDNSLVVHFQTVQKALDELEMDFERVRPVLPVVAADDIKMFFFG